MLDVIETPAAEVIGYRSVPMLLRAITNMLNLGQTQHAEATLADLLREHPTQGEVWALQGGLEARRGRPDLALPMYRHALELDPKNIMLHSAYIFALDQSPDVSLEEAYRARRAFNDLVKTDTPLSYANDADPQRPRLRVGYVSGDFKNHSAAFGWAPILICHNRDEVEVFAYSCSEGSDWVAEEIQSKGVQWRAAARWGDERLYAQIQEDRIDILVDLSGHSSGNRLPVFARKPAPVQITMIGYITGTGLDAMDYMFADEDTIHPDEERWYAEEIVRLPRIMTFWPTDPESVGEVQPLPALQNGFLTFGVFNRLGKIQPACARAWGEILRRLPDARLVVKSPGLGDPHARLGLEAMFREAGCDVARMEFLGSTVKNEHMKTYHRIDVALDPSPHGGGMSTLEAAWMGVPTLTMPHVQIPSRIATTVARELSLSALVVDSWDAYIEQAVSFDSQRAELAKVRALLREMMRVSSFGDHGRYCRAVEQRYRELWQRWCRGDVPKKAAPLHLVEPEGERWDADSNAWVSA